MLNQNSAVHGPKAQKLNGAASFVVVSDVIKGA
jgi:hypothetical protein